MIYIDGIRTNTPRTNTHHSKKLLKNYIYIHIINILQSKFYYNIFLDGGYMSGGICPRTILLHSYRFHSFLNTIVIDSFILILLLELAFIFSRSF